MVALHLEVSIRNPDFSLRKSRQQGGRKKPFPLIISSVILIDTGPGPQGFDKVKRLAREFRIQKV